jgi:hypothetical protein
MALRRRDIALFSTSAIDLLACGLAAVLVLWVLTLGSSARSDAGERQAGYGEIRLRQFGVWHFEALRIKSADFSLDRASGSSSANPSKAVVSGTDPHIDLMALQNVGVWNRELISGGNRGRIVTETSASKGSSDPFAGEIALTFDGVMSNVSVELALEICTASETHYIEVRRLDFRRPRTTRYVIQCKDQARETFRNPLGVGAPDWQKAFAEALRTDASLWKPTPVEYLVYDDCDLPQTLLITYKRDGTVNVKLTPRVGASREIDGAQSLDLLAKWASAPPATTGQP